MPKISDLPSGIPTTADVLPLVQGGTTKKATFNDVPVSSATQTALNLKQDIASLSKTSVGLGNVDNTSDVNKPVSTAVTAALQTATFDRVSGLVGNVNATTPLTKYDLQAVAVTLRNLTGLPVTRLNTATLTCDLGLAGSIANGRDQAAVFTAGSWIYLYFIWNGTTLATLASTTVPASFTGSTLPSGYTHWAFATALRWNASSNIIPVFTMGSKVDYDLSDSSANRVLTSGVATTMTTISAAGFIPPIATIGKFDFILLVTDGSLGSINLYVRKTGSSTTGRNICRALVQVTNAQAGQVNTLEFSTNAAQSFDYKIDHAPSGGGGAYIDVQGYTIPNGDV